MRASKYRARQELAMLALWKKMNELKLRKRNTKQAMEITRINNLLREEDERVLDK